MQVGLYCTVWRYAVVVSQTRDNITTGGCGRYRQRVDNEDDDRVAEVSLDDGSRLSHLLTSATARPATVVSVHEPQRQRTQNDGKRLSVEDVRTSSHGHMPGFEVRVRISQVRIRVSVWRLDGQV